MTCPNCRRGSDDHTELCILNPMREPDGDFTPGGLHIATINWALAICTSVAVMCAYEGQQRPPYTEAAHRIRDLLKGGKEGA